MNQRTETSKHCSNEKFKNGCLTWNLHETFAQCLNYHQLRKIDVLFLWWIWNYPWKSRISSNLDFLNTMTQLCTSLAFFCRDKFASHGRQVMILKSACRKNSFLYIPGSHSPFQLEWSPCLQCQHLPSSIFSLLASPLQPLFSLQFSSMNSLSGMIDYLL